jgi:Platelet-activating factor acetylhydrolase, isoform II
MLCSRYVSYCFISASFLLFSTAVNAGQVLLPKPNGLFQVGMGAMELIDESRVQPFAATVQHRKFMVSLFYPVKSHKPTTPVSYMPPQTAAFEDGWEQSNFGLESPNGTFERLALQLAAKSPHTQDTLDFPVVLFSPAEATNRLFYSVIAQTIASSGYIVITIDAPLDVDIVEYPDGSVDLINGTIAANYTAGDIDLAISVRAQDASFVLNQLGKASVISQLIPGFPQGLNVSKVAMFGHSLGGAATAAAMLNDNRIAGGVAMDGALFGPVIQEGLDRPFMLMADTNRTRTNDNNENDPANSWFDIWPNLRGWKLDIILANSLHYTFSDFPIVLETLGIVPNATTAGKLLVTDLNGSRALKIVTTYITAFFDMVLKCKPSPLLEGPVAAFPEVTFER